MYCPLVSHGCKRRVSPRFRFDADSAVPWLGQHVTCDVDGGETGCHEKCGSRKRPGGQACQAAHTVSRSAARTQTCADAHQKPRRHQFAVARVDRHARPVSKQTKERWRDRKPDQKCQAPGDIRRVRPQQPAQNAGRRHTVHARRRDGAHGFPWRERLSVVSVDSSAAGVARPHPAAALPRLPVGWSAAAVGKHGRRAVRRKYPRARQHIRGAVHRGTAGA
ncbi:hypothetical protein CCAE64S_00829 [Castellaniella caeni]